MPDQHSESDGRYLRSMLPAVGDHRARFDDVWQRYMESLDAIRSLEEQLEGLRSELELSSQEIDHRDGEIIGLQEQLEAAQQEVAEREQAGIMLVERLRASDTSRLELKEQVETCERRLAQERKWGRDMCARAEDAEESLERVSAAFDLLGQSAVTIEEHERLKEQLETVTRERDNLDENLARVQRHLQVKAGAFETAKRFAQEAEAEKRVLQEQLEALTRNRDYERRIARMNADTAEGFREQLEIAREVVVAYDDLQKWTPPHWRNQGKSEILARNFLTSNPATSLGEAGPTHSPATSPPEPDICGLCGELHDGACSACTCPAGTYDKPNAVHEDYCASNPAKQRDDG